jgi:hypothetical protein
MRHDLYYLTRNDLHTATSVKTLFFADDTSALKSGPDIKFFLLE